MSTLTRTLFAILFCSSASLTADVAVVLDCYRPSLGTEDVTEHTNIEECTSWQYLQYHLQKRGDTLVLNNLGDNEIETLLAPTTTAVIFNNPPWWSGKDLFQLLPSIHAKKILLCWEPPTVLPQMYDDRLWNLFDVVLIWDSTRQDNKHVFHFCYPNLQPLQKNLKPFSERRLLTQISRNKFFNGPHELYSLRKTVNTYFDTRLDIDFTFYGQWWNPTSYRTCGGEVHDKIATLQNFRFSICFENTKNVHGYITEKIFDCFAAGCIPVYYGAPDIADYIPKSCYIAWEDFGSADKVYEHLKNIKEDEYLQYLESIRTFISSDAGKRFSNQAFVQKMLEALEMGKDEKTAAKKT